MHVERKQYNREHLLALNSNFYEADRLNVNNYIGGIVVKTKIGFLAISERSQ